jgi:hypothetical protein
MSVGCKNDLPPGQAPASPHYPQAHTRAGRCTPQRRRNGTAGAYNPTGQRRHHPSHIRARRAESAVTPIATQRFLKHGCGARLIWERSSPRRNPASALSRTRSGARPAERPSRRAAHRIGQRPFALRTGWSIRNLPAMPCGLKRDAQAPASPPAVPYAGTRCATFGMTSSASSRIEWCQACGFSL